VPDLLIHSMSEFSDLMLNILRIADAREVVEIGAEFGGNSQALADHLAPLGGHLTSIDPAPNVSFLDWVKDQPHVRHVAEPSLTALPALADIDAWVIDGDHNYYTVHHELEAVAGLCRRDGKPLLAMLHDVGWPWARRDLYYAPDAIPDDWRHAYSWDDGVTLDHDDLVPGGGFRGRGQFACALHHGGPRNGVLTAVEDFVDAQRERGSITAFAFVPAVFGLGVLFSIDAPWAPELAGMLDPWHENTLLARMEENRLRNYLKVIEWQDRASR
jgi:hypothetical protein